MDDNSKKFMEDLIKTLDKNSPKIYGVNRFFVSTVWFFVAVFSVIVNIIMLGIIFWQHMRIDYLISKIISQ